MFVIRSVVFNKYGSRSLVALSYSERSNSYSLSCSVNRFSSSFSSAMRIHVQIIIWRFVFQNCSRGSRSVPKPLPSKVMLVTIQAGPLVICCDS